MALFVAIDGKKRNLQLFDFSSTAFVVLVSYLVPGSKDSAQLLITAGGN